MDELNALCDLTRAAETCNALSRGFIEVFGIPPELSTDAFAADLQVQQRIKEVQAYAAKLEVAIYDWNRASEAIIDVAAAVGIALPPIYIDGQSHQTAHEAARYLCVAVLDRYRHAEGFEDGEYLRDLANRLEVFSAETPDLYARIQGEHHEAMKLLPAPDTAEQNGSHQARAQMVVMGDEGIAITKIAESKSSADDRMRKISGIDSRAFGWTSDEWAALLGVSDAAIRKSPWWKVDRNQILRRDE